MSLARDALGIGLRRPHVEALLAERARVDFLEVIAENYLDETSLARARLGEIAGKYPVVGHGVGMNLAGAEPLDWAHIERVRALIRAYRMPWFSDHLCWSASAGHRHHDLLPVPYDPELVPYVAARARAVQESLGVPFGIENLSSYLAWGQDRMPEWEFYRAVVDAAGCWYMLDINNIYVSSINHGFDPMDYLASVRWDRVLQVHIAGHLVRPDGLRHDTHDRPVCAEVWELYRKAWSLGGPFPTLLEWDDQIPTLPVLLDELATAARVRA